MRPESPPLDWADWGTAAFARASRQNRPVLLYLGARWSAPCRRFEAQVARDTALLALVRDEFVAVGVDVELRPDLADRYGLGGWPSLLVLTPEGDALTGGHGVEPDRLSTVLPRVLSAFRARRAELLREAAAVRAAAAHHDRTATHGPGMDRDAPRVFIEWALQHRETLLGLGADVVHVPAPECLSALLAAGAHRADPRALGLAEEALAVMLASPLCGSAEGAVCRASRGPAWSEPEPVVVLDLQALLIETLLDAAAVLDASWWGEQALRAAEFLVRHMVHPDGGFVQAIGVPAVPARGRVAEPGAGDPRRFVDANAIAVRALLHAGRVLGRPALSERAVRALESVIVAAFARGAGLAHVVDPLPRVRGLLADQVAAAAALIEAFDASGMRVYVDLAQEVMLSVLRKHAKPGGAALADRLPTPAGAGDVGRLGEPLFPLEDNALAARVLARLAARTGEVDLLQRAGAILDALGGGWQEARAGGGPYVLATLEVAAGATLTSSLLPSTRGGGPEHA